MLGIQDIDRSLNQTDLLGVFQFSPYSELYIIIGFGQIKSKIQGLILSVILFYNTSDQARTNESVSLPISLSVCKLMYATLTDCFFDIGIPNEREANKLPRWSLFDTSFTIDLPPVP